MRADELARLTSRAAPPSDPSVFDDPIRWLATELHFCDTGNPTQLAPAYASLTPGYPGLAGLAEVVAARISGALCGCSGAGLASVYSIPLEALSVLVNYGDPDDGMVDLGSCVVTGNAMSGEYSSPWYKAAINHADSTCRNGNGVCAMGEYISVSAACAMCHHACGVARAGDFGDDRQPCQWFGLRT